MSSAGSASPGPDDRATATGRWMTIERPLVGGMDARYAPVRVGDTVRRAAGTGSGFVRDLLVHLEAVGFDGAPRYVGIDEQGREILSWVDGDVPLPPYPAWAMKD